MLPEVVDGWSATLVPRIEASDVFPTAIGSTQWSGAMIGGQGGHVYAHGLVVHSVTSVPHA